MAIDWNTPMTVPCWWQWLNFIIRIKRCLNWRARHSSAIFATLIVFATFLASTVPARCANMLHVVGRLQAPTLPVQLWVPYLCDISLFFLSLLWCGKIERLWITRFSAGCHHKTSACSSNIKKRWLFNNPILSPTERQSGSSSGTF